MLRLDSFIVVALRLKGTRKINGDSNSSTL